MNVFINTGASSPVMSTPLGTEIIGKRGFNNCSCITMVFITEGVTEIQTDAFSNCDRLGTIHLPSTLRVIGKNVFKGLNRLQLITFNGTEEEFSKIIVDSSNEVSETVDFKFKS